MAMEKGFNPLFSDMLNFGKKHNSLDPSQNWWKKEHVACVNVGAVALYKKPKKDSEKIIDPKRIVHFI